MKNNGDILLSVLIFAAIAVTVTIGLVNWGGSMLSAIRTVQAKEQAFQIAEAGVDYYRWHLAQSPTDYKDGTTTPGPYYHSFYDKNNNLIGSYSLVIVPPPAGSTKVVITSTATTTAYPNIKKIIQATLAEPSLAQYASVANDYMNFGSGTVVNGPIISNRGIHFDGVAHNTVSSALATDTDPDTGLTQWGVWTDVSPADPRPPTASNNHNSDVFLAGRQNSAAAFPFGSLTVNMNDLLNIATTNGSNPCRSTGPNCWSGSGASGYYVHLNTNNTYDMYKVSSLVSAPSSCSGDGTAQNQPKWGTWSVNTLGSKIGTYAIPSNNVIFVEDNLWVDGTNVGQSTSTRITIVAAANISNMSSTTGSSITVNNDLTYAAYNGSDVVGLIAQANINVGMVSDDNLQIDAALVAESGRVGRYYYNNNCTITTGSGRNQVTTNYSDRTSLTLNGMIATDFRYGFAYNDDSGYATRNINYDGNLLYSPPPSFPLASTQYQMVSWKQLQ
jgi:hypothetical protein